MTSSDVSRKRRKRSSPMCFVRDCKVRLSRFSLNTHMHILCKRRKIPTQRPPPSKRPPPFSAPKVLQRGHISSCNRPERLFLGTCRLTLYEKCSVMVTFLFHQLSCQMSSRAIAHPLVSGALNAKRPWAIGRDFTVQSCTCRVHTYSKLQFQSMDYECGGSLF